jgi:hypothetical protein
VYFEVDLKIPRSLGTELVIFKDKLGNLGDRAQESDMPGTDLRDRDRASNYQQDHAN